MKEEVKILFNTFFALEKLRDIYRRNAPLHLFSEAERQEAFSLLDEAKRNIEQLKKILDERKTSSSL